MDEKVRNIIYEAFQKGNEEAIVQHLIDNFEVLPENVQQRLRLSVLAKALKDETERKNNAASLLETIVDALKQSGWEA